MVKTKAPNGCVWLPYLALTFEFNTLDMILQSSMTIQVQQNKYSIYTYDRDIASLHRQIKALPSARNTELILKYDGDRIFIVSMVNYEYLRRICYWRLDFWLGRIQALSKPKILE